MNETDIRQLVDRGVSHSEISERLQRQFPGDRGFSARSVRRFCQDHGIHYRSGLSDADLRLVVESAVREVYLSCTLYLAQLSCVRSTQ